FNVAWRRGRMQEAYDAADAVVAAATAGFNATLPAATATKAAALAALGDGEGAVAALELPGGPEAWSSVASYHGYLIFRSRTMFTLGRADDAYRSAIGCGTLANIMGTINPAVLPWRSLAAQAAHSMGLHDVSQTLADEELHLARRF